MLDIRSDSAHAAAESAAINRHFWLPFSANRDFHAHPRVITGAEGRYFICLLYTSPSPRD